MEIVYLLKVIKMENENKFMIKDVEYTIRDIEWQDVPNLNLYGFFAMSKKMQGAKTEQESSMIMLQNIGLFTPFLNAIIVKPYIKHMKASIGIALIKESKVMAKITEFVKDITSVMQPEKSAGTPAEKKE